MAQGAKHLLHKHEPLNPNPHDPHKPGVSSSNLKSHHSLSHMGNVDKRILRNLRGQLACGKQQGDLVSDKVEGEDNISRLSTYLSICAIFTYE